MSIRDEIRDGVLGAKSFYDANYLTPGLYLLEIERIKFGADRHQMKFFVVEFKVLESSNQKMRPGSHADYMVKFNKDAAWGNVKNFMKAALENLQVQNGGPFEQIELTAERYDICSREINNPLLGTKIVADAYNHDTAEGKPFTRVKWTHFDPAAKWTKIEAA